ncbi:MAG: glycosyltransferase family 4 protein [Candidatus Bathyarchaeota archaeon]|nr:glycosyltransferase family 4 protein [Candidatus Termiticorpusculum sp.]
MKVCMISGLAKFSGGLENVVGELRNFLLNHNVAVDVFGCSNQDFVKYENNYRLIGVRPCSIFPREIGVPDYGKFRYSLKTWQKIRAFGPYDIIHGHGDNCFFSSLFRDETPFLMTFHGTMAKAMGNGSTDWRNRCHIYAEQMAAVKCDVAIACSNEVKAELVQFYGISPKKIKVIHNGVNVEKFIPVDKKLARKKLSLPENNTYALWVGSNPYRKGLFTAIKAVEKSRCSKLLIAGQTGTNFGKTVFLGKIPEQDLIAAYNAADILLFPTIYEGFPMVPLEALACGLPVVTSVESNMGEIIMDGVHGFIVNDKSFAAYQEKIDQVINDVDVLKEMSFYCRNLALAYCWQNQAEKYWEIYQLLLKNFIA